MRLGTVLKLAGVGALVLIVALIAVVKSIDVNTYREVLVQAAKAATGRDLAIRGKLSLKLSLTPALIAEDVTLSNAPWGSRPDMMRLQRLRADIGLLPLLVREVRLNRLQLSGPDILLERNSAGQVNWDFGPQASAAASTSAIEGARTPTTFKVGQVSIDHGLITYRDAGTARTDTIAIEQFSADADTLAAPIGLHARGSWNGQHGEISGVLGPMNGLLTPGKPYPVKLKAVLPGLVATTNGTVSVDKARGTILSLQVTADATELAEAVKLAGYSLPSLGAARIALGVIGPVASPSLVNIDAALGRRDMLALTAKGTIKTPVSGEGVDLVLFAEGENISGLNRGLDLSLPVIGPVKGSAHLTDADGGWRLGEIKFALGHSDLAGDITVRVRAGRPSVEARLTSSQLDLAELSGGGKSEPPKARAEASRLFPDDPMPLAAIGVADADLSWKIDRVIDDGLTAQHVEIALSDKGGRLVLTPKVAALAGGKASGSLMIDASGKIANVSLNADAEKVRMGDLLKGFNVSQGVHGGKTTLHAVLKGNGNSIRAVLARLNGEMTVVSDKATLDNAYADVIALDVLRQLAPWTQQKNTEMQCLVSRFTIADGMAHSEALLFDTDVMTVSGQGSINLANEVLDLTVAPKPKDTSLLSLALPLDVGGTLAHPTVTPNRGAIVKGVAGVAAGVALGPIGALLPLVSSGSDEVNPCVAALSQPKKAPPPKKSGGKGVVGEVGKAVQGLFGD
ncbi:AsmA family protein [Telmatospirillum sp.]|uniref:AsmA family protein n=1 Tax=Telmatospirillum sp. TaxID=2079197 RepID=UPI00284EA031|nr:AsmA family protein [Telmatospirillum sp.]MDR3439245.1 AsmA family protein [Telmatospirillum sp.]